MNKTFSLILALLLVVFASSFVVNNENEKNSVLGNGSHFTNQSVVYSDSVVDLTDVFTGVKTLYDLQSNAVTQHLIQNPYHPDTLHAVFMQNLTPGIPSNDRRSIYLVNTNRGLNWVNKGSVPNGITSGFPSIDIMSDGKAVIGCHAAVNSPPLLNSIIAVDSLPLAGAFKVCDPGQASIGTVGYMMIAVTGGSNKISFISSFSATLPFPVTYSNVLSNSANCTFTGWQGMNDIAVAGNYSLARAENGTIGLAYLRFYGDTSVQGYGDVRFIESTDDGLTWSSPLTIYNAQTDSCFQGALAGVDLVYTGNVPKVTFNMAWIGYIRGLVFHITGAYAARLHYGHPILMEETLLLLQTRPILHAIL